jgi:WD40 repeat protein
MRIGAGRDERFGARVPPIHVLLAPCLWMCLFSAAHGSEPPTDPFLRVDPGEHTAPIRSLAADKQGRWLATVSVDKTLRIWDLTDGRLKSTFRPPIGQGTAGELWAVAMSPDGGSIAAGGYAQFYDPSRDSSPPGYSIYIVDRATGRLLRRISGVPQPVISLDLSPDGRILAVGHDGNGGLRLLDVKQGRVIAEDLDYAGPVPSVSFAADGRLLTASHDGLLRLYRFDGSHLTLLTKRAAPDGDKAVRARFSPDGKRIAVGFTRSPAVDVLDGTTLAPLASLHTSSVAAGYSAIAWSRDGKTLFAGQDVNGSIVIRRWSVDGGVSVESAGDWPVASNTIFELLAFPGGRLAFCSAAPTWGLLDAAGHAVFLHGSPVVDFRNNLETFRLSADGAQFSFGYEGTRAPPVVFDIEQRAFLPAATRAMAPPSLVADGLVVSNWLHSQVPTLNGATIKLGQTERSHALALLPDGSGFVLGTDNAVRLYSRDGTLRWARPATGGAWAVNVSGDGRWVAAARSDGTIRWYRALDGAEQFLFYPHPDKARWVLWTPGGYYDVSPGAEDLIGWQLNRGEDAAADFFPASRFREKFYRPDIITKVVESADQAMALKLANQAIGRKGDTTSIAESLPPVVKILAPADGSTAASSVTLKFEARSAADAPVTEIRARVNGLAVKLPDPSAALAAGELTVPMPPQDTDILLFAVNRNGISSPGALHVLWSGVKSEPSAQEFGLRPKLYVLAVGISNYKNPDYQLGLAAKDAQDFVATFKKQKDLLYRDVEVKLLVNEQASRDAVLDGLDWLRNQVTAKDVGMLFLAGHGETDPDGRYYFLPYNADADKLRSTGVVFSEVRDTLANLAGKALFFVDTCYAGSILGGRRGVGVDLTGIINELTSAENGVVVFSSSTGRQYSLEDPSWGNGAFTKAVVEGINGKADLNSTGRITYKMLDFYISERVKELTHGRQTPVTQGPGGVPDFPIAMVNLSTVVKP